MSLLELMVASSCRISDPCRRADNDRRQTVQPDPYDFIVVGAGVAGSVVGGRLSENPDWRVLVVEAGPEEPSATAVPALVASPIGTRLDWAYKTQSSDKACLSTGGVCSWPRGKMVGGTGAMTGMMYTRGNREIFDDWARAGNVGWSFEECLPFFKKSESNRNPEVIDEGYHGTEGPLPVSQFDDWPRMADDLLRAGGQLGYRVGDLNGRNQTGFAIAQMMVEGGVRASTSRAYLRPAYRRPNLDVRINSRVTKIIIDEASKRALGIKYYTAEGKLVTARAAKEVILAAGAVGSPHLLLLSGVGPSEDLTRLNIPVVNNLRVGYNLHNHVSVGISFLVDDDGRRRLTEDALKRYLENGTGPVGSTGLTQTTAFVRSRFARRVPDLQLFFDGFSAGCSRTGEEEECEDSCGTRTIGARPTNVMPRSKGELRLRSADPFDPPAIRPGYLEDERDVEVLVEGIKQAIKIFGTEAMRPWKPRLVKEPAPMCKHIKFGTDDYWRCLIRTETGPENHPAGSCKMGPVGDPDAVVDPELRVHGLTNLRVMDASVFPFLPNSNPVAAIVMLAEKGAHIVSSAWSANRT
ncbi:hypothetical protein AAG570_008314 [Ranatra chinensis]|uniref:Glucose-methanol-choline oxidoreductase N-terminal domain-containing protein n=1 Tax=Ranatra chinensis TaxID=642074 RepID=A0ABD0XST0_9HEMI